MKNVFILALTVLASVMLFSDASFAHPGNTSADGSHYCWTNCSQWGEVYGQKHYHGGSGLSLPSYSPSYSSPTFESCPLFSTYSYLTESCNCNSGYYASNGQCKSLNSLCVDLHGIFANYSVIDQSCECSYGYVPDEDGQCVSRDNYCEDSYGSHASWSYLEDYCACDSGYVFDGNECVAETSSSSNKIDYAELIDLYDSLGSTCIDNVNGYLAEDGNCYCNDGYVWNDELALCELKIQLEETICGLNSSSDGEGLCVCNPGYEWASSDENNLDCTLIEVEVSEEQAIVETAFTFTDVDDKHKNYQAIDYLNQNGIIGGYSDGSFKPGEEINRAELLKILVEAKGVTPKLSEYKNCFSDVGSVGWYVPYVCYAKEKGWTGGYQDGSFKPGKTVTRAEAIKILLESQDADLITTKEEPFLDVKEGHWFMDYIVTSNELGILEQSKGNFYPEEAMRRSALAEILYRLLIQ